MAHATPADTSSAAASRVWTTLDLLNWTRAYFERKHVESARLEAELLLAEALGCSRIQLYTDFERPVSGVQLTRFREFVKRRAEQREPLQYILGYAEFLELKLKVTSAVLIPRPETEELAEWASAVLQALPGERLNVLDIGTGSGCLALALAAREPRAAVAAVDLSAAALEVARENAVKLGLTERVTFWEGDSFAPLPPEARGQVDLIVSNPPYVDPDLKATLPPEVRDHEPAAALFASERGLAVLQRIVSGSGAWLKPGGRLGLEISPEQAGEVVARLQKSAAFVDLEVVEDRRKLKRFVHAQKAAAV